MRSLILKKVVQGRWHERVRGGYRFSKFLAREMASTPIEIIGYPPLYVDLRGLDEHALSLFRESPLPGVPHEPALTEVFRRFVNAEDTVFDVGANLGLHTLTFSKIAKRVIAFEPNPALIQNLKKTFASIPNADLLEVCLSDSDGTVEFHISDWDHMLSSMSNWTGQPTTTKTVPARAIDSLIAEAALPKPDVLKVDVEGAELLVFRGAGKLFSDSSAPRTVIFEELNSASQRLGIPDGAAADFLKEKGYSLYLIETDRLVPLEKDRPHAANLVATRITDVDLRPW